MARRGLLADPPLVVLSAIPLLATLAVLVPLVTAYASWLAGACRETSGSSLPWALALAAVVVVACLPAVALAAALPRAVHAGIALFAGAALFLVPATNVVSNLAFHRVGRTEAGGSALLFDVALALLFALPVLFAREVHRARVASSTPANESWERVLAAAGAWACGGATFARWFAVAQGVSTAGVVPAFALGVLFAALAAVLAAARAVWLLRLYAGKLPGLALVEGEDLARRLRGLPFIGEGPYLVLESRAAAAPDAPYRSGAPSEPLARVSADRARGLAPSLRAFHAALAVLVLEAVMLVGFTPRFTAAVAPPRAPVALHTLR